MPTEQSDAGTPGDYAFTPDSLPAAIGNLFAMNNYDVDYHFHIHGAEVDIVARAKGDPFSRPIYVEATVEYVSTEKYGKDTTKFILLARKEPNSTLLCVSSKGFTPFVKERARESGIQTLSYDELFAKFEKFATYLDLILKDKEVINLVNTYEEPQFNDEKGTDIATKWLGYWRRYAPEGTKWLIVLGEYGTGKTALTKVMQYRWLQDYHKDPATPIPIRIELRNFSRQFDAKGLLHHFLDHNGLGHISIEFMMHLIRTGRVILLLDGYDEMAQFLNARERRACLSALAELASDGAKGILTSRPNYFTEAEELNVFEALYRSLEQNKYHISQLDRSFVAEERSVDELVEHYVLNRYERNLQDLTPQQTQSLVRRILSRDQKAQDIVISILERVFREETIGSKLALSGKPVIITYLLELVDDLRVEASKFNIGALTEWQVYKLIVDKLMLRDLRRSPLSPFDRRRALQKIAVAVSGRDVVVADEQVFHEIIDEYFQNELRRLSPEERRNRRNELFEELRSSATLTRAVGSKKDGWIFSHNSLREFLTAEMFLYDLSNRSPRVINIPITFAMRSFAASIGNDDLEQLWQALSVLWPQRANSLELGPYLTLLWDAARRSQGGIRCVLRRLSGEATEYRILLNSLQIKDIDFGLDLADEITSFNLSDSTVSDSSFSGIEMPGSAFHGAVLDTVSFKDTDLTGADFSGSLLFECDLTGADVSGADFRSIDSESSILVKGPGGELESIAGKNAIGYLNYRGAVTDEVESFYIFRHHPKYSIVFKILEKVSSQKKSQLRGLTQRGEAHIDPPFARKFVDRLVGLGWLEVDNNELVSVPPAARSLIQRIVSDDYVPVEIAELFTEN